MTRKALRKRRRAQEKQAHRAGAPPRPAAAAFPWMTVSALVASAALTTAPPARASAPTGFLPAFAGTAAATQDSGARRYDIPAGPIGDVVSTFGRLAGLRVTFAIDSIATLQSPGVSGVFTIERALAAILAGTGITFQRPSPALVVLDLQGQTDSVQVTGAAPTAIVSSPKYTQPLRDVPQTVVIIPETVLQDQNAVTLRDALRNTPGITLTAGEGGTAPGDNLLIRGFSARNDVYIDGARDPGVVSRDTFNTETIEVAKGPSSVTTGRGSTGGSVNLVTKAAGLEDFADVRFSVGNASQRRSTVDINHRLGDGSAFRFNGMWQDSGVPGRDAIVQKGWGFAPSIAFGLARPTTVTLAYQRLQQDNLPDYGLPGTLPEPAVAAGRTVDDLDFGNFYGLLSRDHEDTTSDILTGTVQHHFRRGLSVRNLTRYGRNTLDRVVTPPRAATAANAGADPGFDAGVAQIRRTDTKYQYRDDRAITNQTDLQAAFSTGSISHDAVAGVELAHDRQPTYAASDLFTHGRPPVTDLFRPDPGQPYTPSIAPTGARSEARATSVGLYGFDTIKLNDKVQVDLGLRWDRIEVDYATIAASGAAAVFGRTDRAFSGRSGILVKPAARGSIYGAVSTSFNPSYDGAFGLTLSGTGVNNEALPPERSRNFEIGAKWDVTPRLFATAAIFNTRKVNARTTDATTGATILAGNQQVRGLELGLSGFLTRSWAAHTGLSLMDGRIQDSLSPAEVDKRLSYVPEKAFNVWSTYELPTGTTVGAGGQYTGGYYFTNNNALATANAAAIQRLTRYWLFNAMVTQRVNSHFALQINGSNLANERYVERGYTGHFIPGPGRSLTITPVITF